MILLGFIFKVIPCLIYFSTPYTLTQQFLDKAKVFCNRQRNTDTRSHSRVILLHIKDQVHFSTLRLPKRRCHAGLGRVFNAASSDKSQMSMHN